MVKNMGVDPAPYVQSVWLQASESTALNLSLLIHKIGININLFIWKI